MDTRVVFGTSADGVKVAASIRGSGPPLVYLNVPLFSHCRLPGPTEPSRHFRERMASRRTFTMADVRGSGLAERDSPAQKLDDYVSDLVAVFDAAELPCSDVLAIGAASPIAMRFAARHPARVRRLVLWGATAGPKGSDGYAMASPAVIALMREDWDLFLQIHASRSAGSEPAVAELVAYMRQCSDQRNALAFMGCLARAEVVDDAERLQCPTLVTELDENTLREAGHAERLARLIPGAELAFLPNHPLFGWTEPLADAMDRFDARLDGRPKDEGEAPQLTPREHEVLALLACGRTNAEIADVLTISRSTVDRHVANIYARTGTRNRAEATRWAIGRGIVPPSPGYER